MQEIMENQELKKALIKKYHALCSHLRLDDIAREGILSKYGAESSRELTTAQLMEVCNALNAKCLGHDNETDSLRKKVIGTIIGYLEKNKEGFSLWDSRTKVEYAKGTALRASGMQKSFNRIPADTLRSIWSQFNNMQKNKKQ